MAFVTLNGFDVEHASNLLIYENLFPEIQHLNGKGVTDKYTKTDDVKSVTYIDVMRVLPYAPRFRKLGAANNGAWHNSKNEGGFNNAPESEHYTIPVDLYYDEGVQISSPQVYSTPVQFKSVVMTQLIKSVSMSINVITHAKQWEGFFRDSFSATPSEEEIANSLFAYDTTVATNADSSAVDAFNHANAVLTDGVPELGAFIIPMDERQAFISTTLDRIMKRQYMTNASEAAAQILANGYINPFTGKGAQIDVSVGLAGMYDGVPMYLLNKTTREFMYTALGIDRTESTIVSAVISTGAGLSALTVNKATFETEVAKASGTYEFTYVTADTTWKLSGTAVTLADYGISVTGSPSNGDKLTIIYTATNYVAGLLDKIQGEIVYGAGTVRGIVGPSVQANVNPFFGGVYILPQCKIGVEVLNGKTIKFITDDTLTSNEVKAIKAAVKFTPIDGEVVTANDVLGSGIFNDNSKN